MRAVVVKDDHLLVMYRNKFGQEYYTLIGGGIDVGETPTQALIREVHEETGVQLADPQLVLVEEAGPIFGTQYVYLCHYVAGEPALHSDSEEAKIHALGKNLYVPMWLPLAQLPTMPFRSEELKQALLHGLQHGFAQPPAILHTDR